MTNESGEFESLIDDVDGYFVFKISKDGYKGLKFNLTPTNIRRGEDTHMGKCKLVVSSSSESEDKIYYSNANLYGSQATIIADYHNRYPIRYFKERYLL